jgi:hypothetical protein
MFYNGDFISVSNITQISANATFTDATSASWKYRLTKYDGTVVSSGTLPHNL